MKPHDNGRPVALVQITDTHLFADPAARYRGWCTDAALDRILARLGEDSLPVDAFLLSGDLAEDESPAAYTRLQAMLSAWDCPCYALPGNHDDPAVMRRYLTSAPGWQLLGEARLGQWQLLLLDSRLAGSTGGQLSEAELHRARRVLDAGCDPCLIAVHHHPVAIGSAWMDGIGLANGAELIELATRYPQVRAIAFGHVHQRIDMRRRGLRLLACPSTWRQFMPGATRPCEDPHRGPGYRRLWLHPDGRLQTRIYRLHPDRIGNEERI